MFMLCVYECVGWLEECVMQYCRDSLYHHFGKLKHQQLCIEEF